MLAGGIGWLVHAGDVPTVDVVVSAGIPGYLLLLHWLRFRIEDRDNYHETMPDYGPSLLYFRWLCLGTGVLLPWVSICWYEGEVQVLSAPLYLTMVEALVEILCAALCLAWPVQVLCSLLYNAYRITSLWAWVSLVCLSPSSHSGRFSLLHQGTAAVNLFLWTVNLLCVLIPLFLVHAFHPKFRAALGPEELEEEADELRRVALALRHPPTKRT